MKFIISTQELNYIINKLQNVVGQKATVPILSNFLIEAANDELVITATDLTVAIRYCTEAKVLEEGAITVPAKRFAQLIRELTAVNLEISSNAHEVVTVIAGASRFKLNGMSKEEFPALPDLKGAAEFKIKQDVLKNLLYQTAFAVSREDNRYVLTGVYLQIAEGVACFTGTDGKRLARTRAEIGIDPSFKGSYIIPLKAVEEIQKNLDQEEEAAVFLMEDKIAIQTEQALIITKLLSGEYPDVNRVIPEQLEFTVNLHREELISLLRQISLFTADANHSVKFTFGDGELKLNANSSEIGEGNVSMPVNYQGEKMDIAFNPKFFLDILHHSKNDLVQMGVKDRFTPSVLTDSQTAEAIAQETPLFMMMPMRLNQE